MKKKEYICLLSSALDSDTLFHCSLNGMSVCILSLFIHTRMNSYQLDRVSYDVSEKMHTYKIKCVAACQIHVIYMSKFYLIPCKTKISVMLREIKKLCYELPQKLYFT